MFNLSIAPMFTDGTIAGHIEQSAVTVAELLPFLEAEAAKLVDGTYTRLGNEDRPSDIICDALDITLIHDA